MGGLSKKAYQLEKIRTESPLSPLILDAGGLLFNTPFLSKDNIEQAEITAKGIVEAYNLMGYDAVGVATNDLAGGLSFLENQGKAANFTWLSANLVKKSTGKPIFTPHIIRKIGRLKVGIIGLTGESDSRLFSDSDDAEILPWRKILADRISELASQSDLIILLSNNPLEQNKEIARSISGIHIIVQAAPSPANLPPEQINNTLICQTGHQGKFLGRLLINWSTSKNWGSDDLIGRLKIRQRELDGIRGRLNRYRSRFTPEELAENNTYNDLLKEQKLVSNDMARLADTIRSQQEQGLAPSTQVNDFISLESSLPDQPQILEIVRQTKKRITEANQKKTPIVNTSRTALVGWSACQSCHKSQTMAWQQTPHARAYDTLVKKGQEFDLNCLDCHITTARHPRDDRASQDLNPPEALQAVGCEVCHGPGMIHAGNPSTPPAHKIPGEEICLRCHTPEHDDNFDYRRDLPMVDHR